MRTSPFSAFHRRFGAALVLGLGLACAVAPAAAASIDLVRGGIRRVAGTGLVARFDGVTGAAKGQFNASGPTILDTHDLVYGPDANLYAVVDAQIHRYHGQTGAFLNAIFTGPVGPVAFGPDGKLYLANNNGITRYEPSTGAALSTYVAPSGNLQNAIKMVFGADGRLYVALYNGGVLRYEAGTGAPLGFFVPNTSAVSGAYGLAFAPDGSLLVTSSPGVLRYHGTTGALLGTLVATDGIGEIDLAIGPEGYLYVSHRDGRITRHDVATGARVDTLVAADSQLDFPRFAFTPCTAGGRALCLGRISLQTRYRTGGGQSGGGRAVKLTGNTGYFWFFDAANVEVVAKALDGCGLNQRFWIFGGGLTDVEVTLAARDARSGQVKLYTNPQGKAFQPIQDIAALAACGAASTAAAARTVDPAAATPAWPPAFVGGQACSGLCLNGSRFQVTATYTTGGGATGGAAVVPLTSDTGYLWFFGASNVEVVAKVIAGCGVNGKYWVFAAGLTDVEVVLRVRDSVTGAERTYTNPQGKAFQPIQDTSAFACS